MSKTKLADAASSIPLSLLPRRGSNGIAYIGNGDGDDFPLVFSSVTGVTGLMVFFLTVTHSTKSKSDFAVRNS